MPALFIFSLDLLLLLVGFGYPTGFFLRREVAGQDVFVENMDFGRTFFPSGLERGPALPVAVATSKAPDEYRIFVLGESAAMGYPDVSFSFSRILETMLNERYPATRFTVVNTSMVAINSHVILPIARDCAALQPDLFVVYMGNNEIVGPYGVSDVLGSHSTRLGLVRASIGMKTTRLGQLFSRLLQSVSPAHGKPTSWQGMRMFVDRPIRADDPRMSLAYRQFEENLQDICDVCRAAGAPVIISTVGTNLKDCAPFASLPAADLPATKAAEVEMLVQEGAVEETAQEYAAAIEHYQLAARIDDQRADLQFRLARCLSRVDRVSEARRHYIWARDRDVLRFRADSKINEIIRSTAQKRQADGVYLVDAVRAFENASEDQLPGDSLFYEHVHMTFAGNYVLARAEFKQLEELLPNGIRREAERDAEPLSEAECMNRLVFTDWNRLYALNIFLDGHFTQPPFVYQMYGQERTQRMQAEVSRLKERLEAGGLDQAYAAYRSALERNSRDISLRKDFGFLLLSRGKFDEAIVQFLALKKQLSHNPTPCVFLARAYAAQGRRFDALAECDEALRLRPGEPQATQLREEIQAALRQR